MNLENIAVQLALLAKDWVGIVLPFFIDLINRRIANSDWRFVLSLGICLSVAILFNLPELIQGDFSIFLGKVGLIFTEAQVVYKLYWKDSSARAKIIGS